MSYTYFTPAEIKVTGWMKTQLRIQAEGLSGNLHRVWPDVRDSKWIGGERDGWERVPYWLDGFIPLAYLLKDGEMISTAKNYIDAILSFQCEDGWICPCSESERAEYDSWAVQLISKVLTVYYECSGDGRIPDVLYRVMKNYYELLKSGRIHLEGWARFRWFESFIALDFLWKRTGEGWIRELSRILDEQGFDYNDAVEGWKVPLNKWTFETHVVNLAMMLKIEAVTDELLDGKYRGQAKKHYDILMEYNGTPVGIFTGDECLSGLSPVQGTECCAVAELMYSFERLYAYDREPRWAELLETVTYNAFIGTVSDDMWAHQYDQLSNQISCEKFPGKSVFRTNGGDSHLFGLEPNYGCCTANFNQALPKFALSGFISNGRDVISAVPIPSVLKTPDYEISLVTDYPFRNSLKYTIRSDTNFTFRIRVPSSAKEVTVNGKAVPHSDFLSFDIKPGDDMTVSLTYALAPEFVSRPHGLYSVKCGSLVFSLPIRYKKVMHEYTESNVERKFPYCDYEYVGQSEWRYAFASDSLSVNERDISPIPFSSENPPVTVSAHLVPIDWGFLDGYTTVAAKYPSDTSPTGMPEEIELYPYGCAKLRMTEMPKI